MAAVLLFWDTNMAAVTSCENTLYTLFFQFSINSIKRISIDTARKRALKYSNLPSLKVIRGLSGHYGRLDRIARFTGPS